MAWIIVLSVLIIGLLAYFLYPSITKMIKKGKEGKPSKSSERELKKQERIEKRQEKKLEKKSRKEKKEDLSLENPHVYELKGDEFGDDFKPLEDPDTKVNYDNLDFGGEEYHSKPAEESSAFSNNIDDMFNEYFLDEKNNENDSPEETVEFSSDGTVDSADGDDEEIREFLEEFDRIKRGQNSLKDDFENLSPEMKALMISNFLDRKDDI